MSTNSKAKRLNPFEHALKRPDTYIGSAKTVSSDVWIFDNLSTTAVQKKIKYNPGLFNIVREILSNAIDNVWRSKEECPDTPLKKIELTINSGSGEISVWNDGYCIPVRQEESEYTEPRTGKVITEHIYPAEMFFGDMFTGTNYDDKEIRKTSGRNGMGAKATNVFSTEFKVECACPEDKAKFVQVYRTNGTQRDDPFVSKFKNKCGYTLITFTPDYEYFKYPSLENPGADEDFISLLKLYAYEVSMITGVMVKFTTDEDTTSIKINSLERYVRMFYPDCVKNKMVTVHSPKGDECVLVEGDEPDMDLLETISQISFVNGIRTKTGGIHIDTWRDTFMPAIVKAFNSRSSRSTKEKVQVKTSAKEVYPYLHMFVRVEVDRPRFGSQTKDELTEVFNEKGESIDYKLYNSRSKKEKDEWAKTLDIAIKKIMKWNFVSWLEEKLLAKMDRNMARKEGSSRRVKMGTKADDANEAGKKNSHLCTAYIAEGLSAKCFVTRGISSIPRGQDFNGSFAVKGKFLNVQNASTREINNNEEVQQLKTFLGLRQGTDYSNEANFKTLRYGKVCILTDADDDGIHIRGLLLNFFYRGYPELVERGYIDSFSTAVAAAVFKGAAKGKGTKGVNPKKLLFYSNPEFKKWCSSEEEKNLKNMEIKYYKGLGSINPKDAPGYFRDKKVLSYFMEGDEKEFMDLGFNEKRSDWRKEWITRGMVKSKVYLDDSCNDEPDEIEVDDEWIVDDDSDDEEPPAKAEPPNFVYEGKMGLSSFVDHQLIIYHKMALRRALPSIWDGLKESQRKILFTILERNYKKPKDLEKVTGAVKEETSYHHGGNSISEAIIKMAQGFVGSNNIPLLINDGEFGCVDPDTRVLIWDGSVKLAKDVNIDDILIGDDGYPRKISKIVNGEDDMYRVTQGYGDDYIVNSQHILTLLYSGHKTIRQKNNIWMACYYDKPSGKVTQRGYPFSKSGYHNSSKLSSEEAKKNLEDFLKDIPDEWEIFDINIQDYLSFPSHVKDKCKGIKIKASIQWEKRAVPMDPYMLGAWLGDGNINKNKHIPKEYMLNDEEIRLRLLAGFIDANGDSKYSKGINYAIISLRGEEYGHIINDLQYISRSLGFKAEIGERECGIMKELTISGPGLCWIPTRIPHKKLTGCYGKKYTTYCSVIVKPENRGRYIGWHIDGNERFLLGDFTVTHNTRLLGGKDHAAARYPFTMAEDITRVLFSIQDDPLLERLIEDNELVEYKFFMPILPMILVNGVKGIASGFSTEIPCYNPLEIVNWIEMWLDRDVSNVPPLVPWYRGYNGIIELVKTKSGSVTNWRSKGILEECTGKEKGWWNIKDLPIGTWTKPFEEWLEYLETGLSPKDKKWKKKDVRGLSDIRSYCTPNKVHFMIKPTKDFIPDMEVPGNLKVMQTTKSFKNMVAIDENDYPHRFDSPEEILRFFCPTRLKYYGLRKKHVLDVLRNDLLKASNKYRFVKGVVDNKLDLHQDDDDLEKIFSGKPWNFDRVPYGQKKELSYEYQLSMQMRSMTVKKLEELKREAGKLTEDIKILESKTIKDMWREDLKKFRVSYSKFLKTRCEE